MDAEEGHSEEEEDGEGESDDEEEVVRADADEDELLSSVRSRIGKKKNGQKLLDEFDEKWKGMLAEEQKQGWKRERTRLHEHPFVPGAPRPLPNCTTPLDFFYQLLPVSFIDAVVERTNTYAVARRLRRKENLGMTVNVNAPPAPQQEEEKKQPQLTDRKELLAFIGCVLCMGINVLRDTKRYWSADLGTPIIKTPSHATDSFISSAASPLRTSRLNPTLRTASARFESSTTSSGPGHRRPTTLLNTSLSMRRW